MGVLPPCLCYVARHALHLLAVCQGQAGTSLLSVWYSHRGGIGLCCAHLCAHAVRARQVIHLHRRQGALQIIRHLCRRQGSRGKIWCNLHQRKNVLRIHRGSGAASHLIRQLPVHQAVVETGLLLQLRTHLRQLMFVRSQRHVRSADLW